MENLGFNPRGSILDELRGEAKQLTSLLIKKNESDELDALRDGFEESIQTAAHPDELSIVVSRMLMYADVVCYDALEKGMPIRFERGALTGKELRILLVCLAFAPER